jgi:anthranilate phosphoribosyltransferase
MSMQSAISRLISGGHLSLQESREVFEMIMSGQATDAQIGAYLAAQTMVGETLPEILGAAQVMRAKATPIPCKNTDLVDIVGTGGDHSGSFNISTASALVAAGAGVRIAKHGNRSVTSKSGAADALKALGVNIEVDPVEVAQCVDEVGIGFLYAPLLHGAMKYAIGPRRELAIRTIFNLLGPLTNPAGAKRQVMGVFSEVYVKDLAQVLLDLGSDFVWVVNGQDGLDEISLCEPTWVAEGAMGQVRSFELDPRQYGFTFCAPEALKADGPEHSAQIIREILDGVRGPARDIVQLNSGAAIWVSGLARDYGHALELAAQSMDSGAAKSVLEQLVVHTNHIAGGE